MTSKPSNSAGDTGARRRPGRPVSQDARRAVLAAAVDLLDERGYGGFSVDEVARRSGVSKSTIYRHWSGGLEIAADAYGDSVTSAVPVRDSGDAEGDLRGQFVRLAAFYASARGRVAAQLLAAGIDRPEDAAVVREKFFAVRRAETAVLIEGGKRRGQLRTDLDTQLMIDLLFGSIVFRLVNGMRPLNRREATRLADVAVPALRPLGPAAEPVR